MGLADCINSYRLLSFLAFSSWLAPGTCVASRFGAEGRSCQGRGGVQNRRSSLWFGTLGTLSVRPCMSLFHFISFQYTVQVRLCCLFVSALAVVCRDLAPALSFFVCAFRFPSNFQWFACPAACPCNNYLTTISHHLVNKASTVVSLIWLLLHYLS